MNNPKAVSTNHATNHAISFTLLSNSPSKDNPSGIIAKTKGLDENNNLITLQGAKMIQNGIATKVNCNLSELPEVLQDIEHYECLCHGIYSGSDSQKQIVTKAVKEFEYPTDDNVIPKTKDYFHYPNQALMMFDIDGYDGNLDEILNIIYEVLPEFKDCAKVISESSSASIYKDDTLLSNNSNYHIYFVAKNVKDSNYKTFANIIFNKLWLAGYGKINLDKNKFPLLRTVIDESVFSPERPDFVNCICEKGLQQKRITPYYIEGNALDIDIKSMNAQEWNQVKSLQHSAKEKYIFKHEVNIQNRKQLCIDRGLSESQSKYIIENEDNGILQNNYELKGINGDIILVKDLLDNSEDYDGTEFTIGYFYWNKGLNPFIKSYKNGGRTYKFNRYIIKGINKITSTDLTNDYSALPNAKQARSEMKKIIKSFMRKNNFTNVFLNVDAGLGKTRTIITEALKQSYKTIIFVPDHRLSNELQMENKADIGVFKGRNESNCELYKFTTSFNQHLFTNKMCADCEYKENCLYKNQRQDMESKKIVIVAHNYLTMINNDIKELSEMFEKVVVDEDITPKLIEFLSVPRGYNYLTKKIFTMIEENNNITNICIELKDEIKDMYLQHRKIGKFDFPSTIDELKYCSSFNNYKAKEDMRTFWRNLKTISEDSKPNDINNNVWLDHEDAKIEIGIKHRISHVWNKPTIFLDATANESVVRHTLRTSFKWHEIRAKYDSKIKVHQFFGKSLSKDYMTKNKDYIKECIKTHFDGVPIISYKLFETDLWFGNLKGTDEMKDVPSLAIIGRFQLSSVVIEKYCNTIFNKRELNFNKNNTNMPINMRNAKVLNICKSIYSGYAGDIYNHFCVGETKQAIGRMRMFDCEGDEQNLYLVTNEIIDGLYLDQIIPIEKFLPKEAPARDTGNVIGNMLSEEINSKTFIRWSPKLIENTTGISAKCLKNGASSKWFNNTFIKIKIKTTDILHSSLTIVGYKEGYSDELLNEWFLNRFPNDKIMDIKMMNSKRKSRVKNIV